MRFYVFSAGLLALGTASARDEQGDRNASLSEQIPFSFPLQDGFPNIAMGSDALKSIETAAHGTLPDGPLPTHISNISATIWQIIAFNELFEVAYFSDLIDNITKSAPGYEIGSPAARHVILNSLKAVQAQEKLHALGANGILSSAGESPIIPCEYVFPVEDFDTAIAFASTFTDIVLGTLQETLTNFGLDGNGLDFIGLIGSVIGQEGEQNGFYRLLGQNSQIPSSQPFLTAAAGTFALSALHQMVVLPGSCPDTIPVPVFSALNVETPNISPSTKTIKFGFATNETDPDTTGLRLVYINQQNVPVVEKPTDFQ